LDVLSGFSEIINPTVASKECPEMCDYSLHEAMTRPAKVGDELETTNFRNTLTRGFASPAEPKVAVCLLPGTEIAFDREAERDAWLPILRRRKIGATVARFRQINAQNPNTHHDALEFSNGEIVLLTNLSRGQRAVVLQLPVTARVGEAQPSTEGRRSQEIVSSEVSPTVGIETP
jgi:hypothetical protein